ncbi:unnamed protein product [Trichobilharzia regenti]|nr:unnamed protein product [Trichobilharzia regenti]
MVEMKRDVARLEIDLRGIGAVPHCVQKSHSDSTCEAIKANICFGLVMGKFLPHAQEELRILGCRLPRVGPFKIYSYGTI